MVSSKTATSRAATQGNPGAAGFGGMLREDKGAWISGLFGRSIPRLRHILGQGQTQVEIEMDLQEAMNPINQRKSSSSSPT